MPIYVMINIKAVSGQKRAKRITFITEDIGFSLNSLNPPSTTTHHIAAIIKPPIYITLSFLNLYNTGTLSDQHQFKIRFNTVAFDLQKIDS